MLDVESSLETLYSTIYLNSDQIMTETMRLLAPLCFLDHAKVLVAITNKVSCNVQLLISDNGLLVCYTFTARNTNRSD